LLKIKITYKGYKVWSDMFKYRVLGYENANVQAYDFALKMETERISEMQVVYPLSIGNTELH